MHQSIYSSILYSGCSLWKANIKSISKVLLMQSDYIISILRIFLIKSKYKFYNWSVPYAKLIWILFYAHEKQILVLYPRCSPRKVNLIIIPRLKANSSSIVYTNDVLLKSKLNWYSEFLLSKPIISSKLRVFLLLSKYNFYIQVFLLKSKYNFYIQVLLLRSKYIFYIQSVPSKKQI